MKNIKEQIFLNIIKDLNILIEDNSVASIAWSIWDNQFFLDEINY